MNRIETKIVIMVSGRLAEVPDSDEKMDLIEELSENLYQRYLDLTADGLGEEEALAQTMESLGDVEELLAYLREVQDQREETDSSFRKEEEKKEEKEERGHGFSFRRDWENELGGLGEKISSAVSAAMDMTADAVDNTWDFVRDLSRQVKEQAPDRGQEEPRAPGRLSFQAQEIRALECRLGNGDVCIHLAPEETDVITLVGDTGELETVLRDGTLQIRQGRTVSASLLFSWGMRASDVELTIPARSWEKLTVITANGDVEIDGELQCTDLNVQSKNGDFRMDTAVCGRTRIQLSRGDIAVAAATGDFQAETKSGDIAVGGNLYSCLMRTASGDVSFRGSVAEAGSLAAYSVSGDIDLQTELLPQKVRLSSTSGDCRLRIPQNIGFRLFTRTVSGDFESNLPLRPADEKGTGKIYLDGGDREITISTVSGDISLYAKDVPPQE